MSSFPPPSDESTSRPIGDDAAIWSYRGYRLKNSEFVTSMVHFYRGELSRANVWRHRLDTTTNWAVVTTGATLTFAFSQSVGHHAVIILNTLLITLFLFIESRRYRYYELWSYRVRHLETDFFAAMLVSPFQPTPGWAESLAESLLHPKFSVSLLEAFGRRFRRNYVFIYIILALAWLAHVGLFPEPAVNFSELLSRAEIGPIPGSVVLFIGVFLNTLIFMAGLFTSTLHDATGEVLPHLSRIMDSVNIADAWHEEEEKIPWYQPKKRRRRQILALVVTDRAQPVSDRILDQMKRGATALTGTGMFSGAQHSVLMIAMTITEVDTLKRIVKEEDPKAFVMITPAKEIFGAGFMPLSEK
ncbi:MAG: DUF2270 domain-containing protein [Anaerolineales bacterium]|nr:DUF2270 domain-containing protein [Anaerolineales bacterium]